MRLIHRQSTTPIYRVWRGMKSRCHDPRCADYPRYGARGITVCDEWRNDFLSFAAYVGDRPAGKTLDRIDNNKGYQPGNVRWATKSEQARNTRRNHMHTIDGVTRCMADWCEILNEPWTSVKKRIQAGRDPFDRIYKRRVYGNKSQIQQNA